MYFAREAERKSNDLQSITVKQKEQLRQSFKVNLNGSGIIPLFYDTTFLIIQRFFVSLAHKKQPSGVGGALYCDD